jgi:uncharacterized C2H2 Zn-finger protein
MWTGLKSRLLRRLGRDAAEYTGSAIGKIVLACDRCGELVDAIQRSEKKPHEWLCGRCIAKEQKCQETT